MKHRVMALIKYVLANGNSTVVSYFGRKQIPAIQRIVHIKKEVDTALTKSEAYQIYNAVISTAKISGDIAEVGVYTGGSARIIGENKGDKSLHLFDTFDGLPETSDEDLEYNGSKHFKKGAYLAPLDSVKKYLVGIDEVYFYKGFFPITGESIKDKTFSFVHLDMDIYQSTLDSLNFFYPRMSKGGIIISHDYPVAEGVLKAIDEFFVDKPEVVIEVNGRQALIVKLS